MKNKLDKFSNDELAKILWNYNHLNLEIKKADVIIVLGSHDTRVAQRGAELFLQGYAPLIVFSGGFGRLTAKDWTKPEAEIFSEIAVKMGVAKQNIIIENKSTNTRENLQFSMEKISEKGKVIQRVLLVQKPYMERRPYAIWKKLFPDIEVNLTSPQMSFNDYILGESITKQESISIIVGEVQRIKVYQIKGYIIPQEIPNNVWQAYTEMVNRGFTTHLLKM